MPSDSQKAKLLQSLKAFRKKYLVEKYETLDESATRIMVNYFLSAVLGYQELEEVKTEYAIKGTYADYVVQVERKKHFIVEVKSIQIDLSDNHLRQAISYAANEGIDWVLLTNGRHLHLYRVIFAKPITYKKICDYDLQDADQLKKSVDCLQYLTRKAAKSGELEKYWKRFQALDPVNLATYLYDPTVVRFLRKSLKKDVKLSFPEEDIFDSLHEVIVRKLELQKPRYGKKAAKKKLDTSAPPFPESAPSMAAEPVL